MAASDTSATCEDETDDDVCSPAPSSLIIQSQPYDLASHNSRPLHFGVESGANVTFNHSQHEQL